MSLLYWRFSIILPVIRTAALVTMTLAPCSAVEPQKPSVTAMIVLLFRAMGATNPDVSLRNPDYLALKFLGSRERETLLDARVRTSGTAKTEPLPIDLGRAYRQDRPANSRFFEVAFPATQEYKKQRVREIFGSLPKDIVYVAIDFQKGDLAAALRNAGWQRNRKTFFIWEGVTFYLPEAAVDATLRFVAAESAPCSLIVFDYAADRLIRGEHDDERMKRSLGLAKFIGEPWQFWFPMNGAGEWIMQRYLKVVSDLWSEGSDEKVPYQRQRDLDWRGSLAAGHLPRRSGYRIR